MSEKRVRTAGSTLVSRVTSRCTPGPFDSATWDTWLRNRMVSAEIRVGRFAHQRMETLGDDFRADVVELHENVQAIRNVVQLRVIAGVRRL